MRSIFLGLMWFAANDARCEAPRLYHTAGLQSPVRAAPDDLLLIAGAGFAAGDRVAYREFRADTSWPTGATFPDTSTANEGIVPIIADASDATALVVRLPAMLDPLRSYELAVANRSGEWSGAVRINDPRAHWLSPATMTASGTPPGLTRGLRIVGQNLAMGSDRLLVRLRGPRELTLRANPSRTTGMDEFVADVSLPASLPVGDYDIAVSRDGKYWSAAPMKWRVVREPALRQKFAIEDRQFGNCRPDDGADDTSCLQAALTAAARSGADVQFGTGVWNFDDDVSIDPREQPGIIVPRGVALLGHPTRESRLVRGVKTGKRLPRPMFVLLGGNEITRLTFIDNAPLREAGSPAAFLQLGRTWYRPMPQRERLVQNIAIHDNQFFGADVAIADAGLAQNDLVITGNHFRSWRLALELAGNGNNVHEQFRIDDAIITGNRFEPGSYIDIRQRQGARAAELGAGTRVDFSGNVADGASAAGLDNAADAPGWRAAFFWHLRGPQEQILIANNDVKCSGDKVGDGEAIALDNNHNAPAFAGARDVLATGEDHITVAGPPHGNPEGRAVDIAKYYTGYWLQIAQGPGVGQSRRVTALAYDATTRRTRVTVAPAWDVIPVAGASRVTVARTFWQVYVIANQIDQRSPLCRKANRTEPEGGAIAMWAQSSDSLVAHNLQFDTDGIVFHQTFSANAASFNSFLDIRGNEIRGKYARDHAASESGIRAPHGAATDAAPPVESFGVNISHNIIDAADANGAGISVPLSWYAGPAPHRWPLIDRLLVFHNTISNTRIGIEIPQRAQVRSAVLYSNRCEVSGPKLRVDPAHARVLCLAQDATLCECPGSP